MEFVHFSKQKKNGCQWNAFCALFEVINGENWQHFHKSFDKFHYGVCHTHWTVHIVCQEFQHCCNFIETISIDILTSNLFSGVGW